MLSGPAVNESSASLVPVVPTATDSFLSQQRTIFYKLGTWVLGADSGWAAPAPGAMLPRYPRGRMLAYNKHEEETTSTMYPTCRRKQRCGPSQTGGHGPFSGVVVKKNEA